MGIHTCLILALETATSICSVALLSKPLRINRIDEFKIDSDDVFTLSEISENTIKRHNEVIASQTERLLSDCNLDIKDLNFIAVSIGPGSFTGLRVGLSFAKGLALGLRIPIIPVSTLEALALRIYQSVPASFKVCALVPARRGESFGQIFQWSNSGAIVPLSEPFIIDSKQLQNILAKGIICGGEGGAHIMKSDGLDMDNGRIITDVQASAVQIGIIASRSVNDVVYNPANLYSLEPLYIKDFIIKPKIVTN